MHVEIVQMARQARKEHEIPHEVTLGTEHGRAPDAIERRFYTVAWEGEVEPEDLPDHLAEKVEDTHTFLGAFYQHVDRGGPDCLVPRTVDEEDPVRGFIVGDVIRLDGEAYLVDSFGFERLPAFDATEFHEREW